MKIESTTKHCMNASVIRCRDTFLNSPNSKIPFTQINNLKLVSGICD